MTSGRQQRPADVEIVEMEPELQSINNNATENVRTKTTTSIDTRMFDTALKYKPKLHCSKIKSVRMVNVLVAETKTKT